MVDTPQAAPISALDQGPKSKDEILSFVEDTHAYLKNARHGLEQTVKEALHFYRGDQWIQYAPDSLKYVRHSLDEWVPTPVSNLLPHYHDIVQDILVSGDLKPVVDPATNDQDDVDAAAKAQHIAHSENNRLHTDTRLYLSAASWVIIAGNVFIHAGWNPRTGKRLSVPKTTLEKTPLSQDILECPQCGKSIPPVLSPPDGRCPQCGNDELRQAQVHTADEVLGGEPIFETKRVTAKDQDGHPIRRRVTMGEVEESVISPLHMYPQPVKDFKDARYCTVTDVMPIDRIKALFGKKAADVVAESIDKDVAHALFDTSMRVHRDYEKHEVPDSAVVKYLRHIPDERLDWKKGKLYIVAAGQILHEGALDSPDEELPFEHLKYRHIEGKLWGRSLFADLIPLQKRVNAIDSHIVQNRKQMVANQWLNPVGSGVSEISGKSGIIINYDPLATGGVKPERLPGISVPPQVLQEREKVIFMMDRITNVSEVLQGSIPSGPETGAAIDALQEQAHKPFNPIVRLFRQGLSSHEHRKIKIVRQKWRRARIVRVVGKNEETEAFHFAAADIHHAEDMNFRISAGIDVSKSAKNQKLLSAADGGLLGDTSRPDIRGRLLEQLEIEGFESEYILHAKKARRVLRALQEGREGPAIHPFDEHAVHLSILRDFIMTVEYEGLDEARRQEISARAVLHQQEMQKKQQEIMQAAQAAKGTGEEVSQNVMDSVPNNNPPSTTGVR